jgi:hypothetical protein
MKTRGWIIITITTLALGLGGCGGVSLRYSASGVDKADLGAAPPQLVAVDVIDGRQFNKISLVNKNLDDDLADLRKAVRAHLAKARLVSSDKQVLPAPASVEQIEALLDDARRQGAGTVLFLRLTLANFHGQPAGFVAITNAVGMILSPVGGIGLIPIVVVNSIPANEEGAHAVVEAIAVDPKTRVILGRFEGREDYDDKVSGWSHHPAAELPDVIKKAVDKALAGLAAGARAGFPDREKKPDLQAILAPDTGVQFHPIAGKPPTR